MRGADWPMAAGWGPSGGTTQLTDERVPRTSAAARPSIASCCWPRCPLHQSLHDANDELEVNKVILRYTPVLAWRD